MRLDIQRLSTFRGERGRKGRNYQAEQQFLVCVYIYITSPLAKDSRTRKIGSTFSELKKERWERGVYHTKSFKKDRLGRFRILKKERWVRDVYHTTSFVKDCEIFCLQ